MIQPSHIFCVQLLDENTGTTPGLLISNTTIGPYLNNMNNPHKFKREQFTNNMIRIPAIKNAVQVASTMASKQIGPAVATALIGLKVDGHPVQVKEGATLLDAINKSGSHVPTLCYHPEFEPKAVCECIYTR